MVPIWFFIGISLFGNGLLILGAGIYQMSHPPADPVVLYNVHANVWWGALLAVWGAVYCYVFRPGRAS